MGRRSPKLDYAATDGRRCGCGPVLTAWLIFDQFTRMAAYQQADIASLQEAFLLFRRLGIDVPSLSARDFTAAHFDLAKRYYPDVGNQQTDQLMANINAARAIILMC